MGGRTLCPPSGRGKSKRKRRRSVATPGDIGGLRAWPRRSGNLVRSGVRLREVTQLTVEIRAGRGDVDTTEVAGSDAEVARRGGRTDQVVVAHLVERRRL